MQMRSLLGVLIALLVVGFSASASGLKAADQSPIKVSYDALVVESTPLITTEVNVVKLYTIEVGSEIAIAQDVETVKIARDVDVGREAILNYKSKNKAIKNIREDYSRYSYNRSYHSVKPTNTINRLAVARRC